MKDIKETNKIKVKEMIEDLKNNKLSLDDLGKVSGGVKFDDNGNPIGTLCPNCNQMGLIVVVLPSWTANVMISKCCILCNFYEEEWTNVSDE